MAPTSIFEAASVGDEAAILSAVCAYRCELRRDKCGNTGLHIAAASSHVNIVKLLLRLGTPPNARNRSRETALYAAAKANLPNIVNLLLRAGALPHLKSSDGLSALDAAIQHDCTEVVELMLEVLPPRIPYSTLRVAVRKGNTAVLKIFEMSVKKRRGRVLSLHRALCERDEALVRYILKSGANPNFQDHERLTPLHVAAIHGNTELIQILLDAGAKLSTKATIGDTPLFAAIQSQNIDSAKLLLEAGADVDLTLFQKQLRRPLLHGLAQYELPEIAMLVLSRGVDPNALDENGSRACRWAAQNGNIETLKVLHSAGCDILASNIDGSTPLLMAALKDHGPVVRYLLESGADCNIQDVNGNTPLLAAIQGRSLSTVRLLCEYGALASMVDFTHAIRCGHYDSVRAMLPFSKIDVHDIDIDWEEAAISADRNDVREFLHVGIPIKELGKKELETALLAAIVKEQYELIAAITSRHETRDVVEDGFLMTPIYVAAQVGNLEIFNLLVEKGFPINKRTRFGQTPLHISACLGHCNIVRALRGLLSTEIVDEDGKTPLHSAATGGHANVVELLIRFGSNINRRDTDGRTALYLACWHGRVEAAAALIKSGASPTIANRSLVTPLHLAASKHIEIVKLLLETEQVEINALDASGLTPLHYASSAEIAELLLRHGADVYRTLPRGQPAVLSAAETGRHEVLALLLPRSPEWLSDYRNVSKLWMLACQHEHHGVFQTLLGFGFELEDLDGSRLIPMATEAALKRNDQTLSALIEHMFATNSLSEPSLVFRLLIMAVKGSCVESTRALAALRGIHEHHNNGWEPLPLAVKAGNRDLVEALLEAGADPKATEPVTGLSVLEIARAEKHEEVIESLEDYMAMEE